MYHLRTKYKGGAAPIAVRLGKQAGSDIGRIIYFRMRGYGCSIIAARPRYGKSVLAKNLCARVGETGRRVIIIDALGEWNKGITEPNFDSPLAVRLRNLFVVTNPTIKLSEMTAEYWERLGFSGGSVDVLERICKAVGAHDNDPEEFYQIIKDLPKSEAELEFYNMRYGKFKLALDKPIHRETVKHIVNFLQSKRKFFYDKKRAVRGAANRQEWYSPREYLGLLLGGRHCPCGAGDCKGHNVLFNVNLRSKKDMFWAGFIIGHFMRSLSVNNGKVLKRIKPIMFVEEASYLFSGDKDRQYLCTEEGALWVIKYGKFDVHIVLISQSLKHFQEDLREQASCFILGMLSEGDHHSKRVSREIPHYNIDGNIRPFWVWDRIANNDFLIHGDEPLCLI